MNAATAKLNFKRQNNVSNLFEFEHSLGKREREGKKEKLLSRGINFFNSNGLINLTNLSRTLSHQGNCKLGNADGSGNPQGSAKLNIKIK